MEGLPVYKMSHMKTHLVQKYVFLGGKDLDFTQGCAIFAEALKDLCVMKKILEVLRYGENDIRFHTDIDPSKDPSIIHQTVVELAMAMMTTLWGGNEQAVLAMVRALAISDLGVSVNRRQMVGFLNEASADLALSLQAARKAFEETGGKVMVFGPGVAPPKSRS